MKALVVSRNFTDVVDLNITSILESVLSRYSCYVINQGNICGSILVHPVSLVVSLGPEQSVSLDEVG